MECLAPCPKKETDVHQRAYAKRTNYTESIHSALGSIGANVLNAKIGSTLIVSRLGAPEKGSQHPSGFVLTMGAYSYSNGFNNYISASTVKIGRYCSIATGASRMDIRHPTDWVSTHPFAYSTERFCSEGYHKLSYDNLGGGVTVGNDVWIGAHALISDDITIGDGAIIAARSVVTKDVDPYTIVGGVPARPIRKRFSNKVIDEMLESRWWNYDFRDFPGETMNRPEAFLEFIEKADLTPMTGISVDLEPLI